MDTQLIICLLISALTIAGFVWNKFTPGTVGCISMILFFVTGCISPSDVLGNIGNSNLVMISSMFVISEGFKRTQCVGLIARSVQTISKGSLSKVMFGFCVASILAATFTGSAVAAFCIVAPIVTATCQQMRISISKVMFCVGLTCIAACGIIPVGSSLSMLAEINGYIDANAYSQYQLAVIDLFKGRGPSLLACLLYVTFLGHRLSPKMPMTATGSADTLAARTQTFEPLSPWKERCAIAVFFLVTLCLILLEPLNSLLSAIGAASLVNWQIPFIGAVVLVVSGVLTSRQACGSLPIDLSLMIVGSLSMGTALANTGAGDMIGNAIAGFATQLGSPYLVGAVFYLIPFLLTQVMQNRTVMAVFVPIAVLACKSMGVSCIGPTLLVGAACTTAFMTPMATPTVPLVMEMGGYDLKSNFKQSLLPAAILSVINILWIMTVYPL